MVLRKSFYIRWSAGRSPRVHEGNPGRDPSRSESAFIAKAFRAINFHRRSEPLIFKGV